MYHFGIIRELSDLDIQLSDALRSRFVRPLFAAMRGFVAFSTVRAWRGTDGEHGRKSLIPFAFARVLRLRIVYH